MLPGCALPGWNPDSGLIQRNCPGGEFQQKKQPDPWPLGNGNRKLRTSDN